jgi:hypothetical protein
MSMLRRAYTALSNYNRMSLLQLKDELARRGLRRAGTRDQLVQRILENENLQQQVQQSLETQSTDREDLGHHNLSSLTKSHLIQEILRRQPNQQISARTAKSSLLEILNNLLMTERDYEVKDLRTLLVKLNVSAGELTVGEICEVMDQISDPYNISQQDLNVIRNIQPEVFKGIWSALAPHIHELQFSQILSIFKTRTELRMFYLKTIPKERFDMDDEMVDTVLNRVLAMADQIEITDLSYMITITKHNRLLNNKLKQRMLSKLRLDLDYPRVKMFEILDALPNNCYSDHKEKVDHIISKIYDRPLQTYPDRAIQALFSLNAIGAPIPIELVYEIDSLTRDYLRRISPVSLYQIAEMLCKQNILSEQIAKEIMEILAGHNFTDRKGLSLYANYLYLLYSHDYFPFVVHRHTLLTRCLANEENLELISLLKLCVCYIQHVTNDSLAIKLLEELRKLESATGIEDYLIKILGKLTDMMKDSPIYSYQFLSYKAKKTMVREQLADHIKSMLMSNYHAFNGLLKYYAYTTPKERLPRRIKNDEKVTFDNLDLYARAIYNHRGFEDFSHIYEVCIRTLKLAIDSKEIMHRETLYCCSSILLERNTSNADTDTFIHLQEMKQLSQELFKRYGTALKEYYLPILYNLGANTERDETQKFIRREIMPLFRLRTVKGELLYKNMVMLGRMGAYDLMKEGYSNLSFLPNYEKIRHPQLMKELLITLGSEPNLVMDIVNFSQVLGKHLDVLLPEDAQAISVLLSEKWDTICPNLRKWAENQKQIDDSQMLGAERSRRQLTSVRVNPSIDNLYTLENYTNARLISPPIINGYIDLALKARTEGEIVEITSKLLKYLAVVGGPAPITEKLQGLLDKYKLWDALPINSAIDFLFLFTENKETLSNTPKPLIDKIKKHMNETPNPEDLLFNAKNQLRYYPSFLHNTQLEPRFLTTDDKEIQAQKPEYSPVPELPKDEVLLNIRLNAICNAYKLDKSPNIDTSFNSLWRKRVRDADLREFKEKFMQLLVKQGSFKVLGLKGGEDGLDERTGWRADYIFTVPRVAIMYHIEPENVYNLQGTEASVLLLTKVIKGQLESIGGWKIIGIRSKGWRDMKEEGKQQTVSHLLQKIRIS